MIFFRYNLLILFFLIVNFSNLISLNYEKESNALLNEFFCEIKPLKIYPFAVGNQLAYEIKKVTLTLQCCQNLQLDQARNLYLKLLMNLISKYNNNSKIRPFLHNFPFNESNAELTLSFISNDSEIVENKFIAVIFVTKKNNIHYKTYDKQSKRFLKIYSENINKALCDFKNNDLIKGKL